MHMLAALIAAQAVSAVVLPRQSTPCSFVMNAVGDPTGQIVEDTIGENRIGGGYPQGNYYMIGHALYDYQNHNCIIDPDTYQFFCTQGASGIADFSLANDGNLMHQTYENYLACPATGPGEDGSWNIFSDAKQNTTGCETVTLRTGGFNCTALGRPSTTSATSISLPTATPSSTQTSFIVCPTDLSSGDYQFPHLIIPTSSKQGDKAFGNSYEAYITPTNTTLFNFDIPATYSGTCSLIFLFPYKTDLDPSAGGYYFSGTEEEVGENGGIDFALLSGIATAGTTYNSTPAVATDYGKTQIIPGNNYTIASYPCQAGQTVSYSATSAGNVELDYFQDSAPMPIGLYVVPCTS
ncbi:GPI anchored cell wall protein-like protein [Acephala macrosclerotiorum]|nr:GPI anchored cell wall protein-like protein [Acephala macrosclerotiorum]